MIHEDCRSGLVLAERRGLLSTIERNALAEHLRVCEHCRLSRLFGQAFDEPEGVRSDDAERLDAMLAAAERWRKKPRSLVHREHKRTAKVVLLVAAITVTATAAAAAIAVRSSVLFAPPAADSTTTVTGAHDRATRSVAVTRNASLNEETPSPEASTAEAIAQSREPSHDTVAPGGVKKHTKTAEVVARPELSAEQLLQRATLARRAGNTVEASRLFRKLQRLYPSSREARLSEVVLGTLLLEQGQAALALAQLNRYLSVNSGQNLAAEALYGKGRALAQLGRTAEERDVWQTLVERFPKSPYVSHARKRLGLTR